MDGVSAEELFQGHTGLTYRDYLLLPGYIDFSPGEVDLSTKITRDLTIHRPIVSSPMDTVTEDKMAIALALLGGLGVIHYNNTPERQISLVEKVKRYKNGFIIDPIILGPEQTITDINAIKQKYGFSGIPITENGQRDGKLIGIVSNRDIDFENDFSVKLKDVMTKDLITAKEGISLADANDILRKSKKGKLPIVNDKGQLSALICRTDLKKHQEFPIASKDSQKRLMVGAAVSTKPDALERLEGLVAVGLDIVVIDSAQGNSSYQINHIKEIKKKFPDVQIIA
ncbi:MAG: IMP dehydrogenase, partial [Spirochaetia bacterium]|nr:IMP dehydrogenase [Spirochaetia bacterium]